jgi:pilus assembly protein CpaE
MAEKILIVDDDLETLRLVGLMLQRQGYQIIAANNGTQGLTMARIETPDLIILDVMMPDMDGYQVTRQLRRETDSANTPILMFTAKSQVDDKVAGYEAGVDDYLTKPVHPAELVAHVKALLARSKARNTANLGRGYMVAAVAPKGGMGVSTTLLNLGLVYHNKNKTDVIQVELRPGQGTWGLDLGIVEQRGLNNLLRMKPGEITISAIEKELYRTSYGARLLMTTYRSKDVELAENTPQIEAILTQLPTMAPMVMLDLGLSYLPDMERVLSSVNEVLLITEPQPGSVQRAKLMMEELATLGFGKSKTLTLVLVNRVRADIQLTLTQVQEITGQPVAQLIPPVPEVAYQATIRNMPIAQMQPEGLVSQQLTRLAEAISQRARK